MMHKFAHTDTEKLGSWDKPVPPEVYGVIHPPVTVQGLFVASVLQFPSPSKRATIEIKLLCFKSSNLLLQMLNKLFVGNDLKDI
nr:hypothetical protein Itr_chr09CG10130 [Ipomoea trifida]